MKRIYFAILMLTCFAGYAQEATNATKPPSIFVLTVNGKDYTVTEGKDLKLDGNFNNPSVSVKMASYTRFDNGKISFNYKSSSTYNYTESAGSKTWTFEAGDCVVFLFELSGQVKLDAIVSNVVEQFGKKNCKIEAVSKQIGDKIVSGKQINVTLAGQKLVQEYYGLEMNDAETSIMAFQNSRKDDGTISEEGRAGVDLVANSVKFGQGH